jgi:hypothetical protein
VEHDEAAVRGAYRDYWRAAATGSAAAMLPYYLLPCLVIGARGSVALNTFAEALEFLQRSMLALTASGYVRSDIAGTQVQKLGTGLVLLSARITRYRADDSVLARVEGRYLFHGTEAGWKIAVAAMHDER